MDDNLSELQYGERDSETGKYEENECNSSTSDSQQVTGQWLQLPRGSNDVKATDSNTELTEYFKLFSIRIYSTLLPTKQLSMAILKTEVPKHSEPRCHKEAEFCYR